MILTYKKTNKMTEALNDLMKVNNDRIAGYNQALQQCESLDMDLKDLFKEIVKKGELNKVQLAKKIEELNGKAEDGTSISGKIHRAWMDLKVTLMGSNRKSLISFAQYNEEIAQHVYRAALNVQVNMQDDIKEMIEQQQEALSNTRDTIKKYREARNVFDNRLAYYN